MNDAFSVRAQLRPRDRAHDDAVAAIESQARNRALLRRQMLPRLLFADEGPAEIAAPLADRVAGSSGIQTGGIVQAEQIVPDGRPARPAGVQIRSRQQSYARSLKAALAIDPTVMEARLRLGQLLGYVFAEPQTVRTAMEEKLWKVGAKHDLILATDAQIRQMTRTLFLRPDRFGRLADAAPRTDLIGAVGAEGTGGSDPTEGESATSVGFGFDALRDALVALREAVVAVHASARENQVERGS